MKFPDILRSIVSFTGDITTPDGGTCSSNFQTAYFRGPKLERHTTVLEQGTAVHFVKGHQQDFIIMNVSRVCRNFE